MDQVMPYLALAVSLLTVIGMFLTIKLNTAKIGQDHDTRVRTQTLLQDKVDRTEILLEKALQRVTLLEAERHEVNMQFVEINASMKNLADIMNRIETKVDRHVEDK